jgi:hypothetical protein
MPLAFLLLLTVAPLATGEARPSEFKTTVEPLRDENLIGPCAFELSIPSPTKRVRAAWITYDRGFDIAKYYSDTEVRAFAQRQAIALMLAHQCSAKLPPTGERGEMHMDVSRGVARSIFAALYHFARLSSIRQFSRESGSVVSTAKIALEPDPAERVLSACRFARLLRFSAHRKLRLWLGEGMESQGFVLIVYSRLHARAQVFLVALGVGGANLYGIAPATAGAVFYAHGHNQNLNLYAR